MKRLLGLLMAVMVMMGGTINISVAESISSSNISKLISPLEGKVNQIIKLPENVLGGDLVEHFEALSESKMFISEGNRFAIIDNTGLLQHVDEVHHPKLKKGGESIRGVYLSENTLLIAVYDYLSDKSYLTIIDCEKWTKKYLSLWGGCIMDTSRTESGFLIVGKKGDSRGIPWAVIVSQNGDVLWEYQDKEAAQNEKSIAYYVELCETEDENIYLLTRKLERIEGTYEKKYQMLVMSSMLDIICTIEIEHGELIVTAQQLIMVDNVAYILCAAYDGEQDYSMLMKVNVKNGTQKVNLIPQREGILQNIILTNSNEIVLNINNDNYSLIQEWQINGELTKEIRVVTSLKENTASIDCILANDDVLWGVGTINKYEKDEWLRTVYLIRIE